MAMQSQAAPQPASQHVQWAGGATQCIGGSCDGTQMYVPVPPPGGCGGFLLAAQGQQGMQMGAAGQVVAPGVMTMGMSCCNGQPMCMPVAGDGTQMGMVADGSGVIDPSCQQFDHGVGAPVDVGLAAVQESELKEKQELVGELAGETPVAAVGQAMGQAMGQAVGQAVGETMGAFVRDTVEPFAEGSEVAVPPDAEAAGVTVGGVEVKTEHEDATQLGGMEESREVAVQSVEAC